MLGSVQCYRVFASRKSVEAICGHPIRREEHSGPEHGPGGNAGPRNRILAEFRARQEMLKKRLISINEKYERLVGLSDVQKAQEKVKEAEDAFLRARANERAVLREMVTTRDELKNVRERLSHIDYSSTMYLQLASNQHELVTQEERQKRELEEAEDDERDSFTNLSNAMRESYEQERARVERTKNWSIIGTVIGTVIGMLGSIYMNRVRTKDLLKAVLKVGDQSDVSSSLDKLASAADEKQQAIATAINGLAEHMSEMSNALQVQNMEALSGILQDSFKGAATTSTNHEQSRNAPTSASLQILSQEIEQYNTALLSLSNAVVALSNVDAANATGSGKIQGDFEKTLEISSSISKKLDEIMFATKEINSSGIVSRLDCIDDRISGMQVSVPSDGPVIRELDETSGNGSSTTRFSDSDVTEVQPNWRVGLKDIALWGSVLGCVYLIMKF